VIAFEWFLVFFGFVGAVGGAASMYEARQKTLRQLNRDPRLCSCSHGLGTHEDGRRCQGQIKRQKYNSHNSKAGFDYVKCPCSRFDGQRPIEDLVEGWRPPEIK
jgi:hypothetical protein